MSEIKKGDRVRVVIEATVRVARPHFLVTGGDHQIFRTSDEVVSIEKLEPPVEVFGPGDIIRDKNAYRAHGSDTRYVIGRNGWFDFASNMFYEWDDEINSDYFTSERFERVNLVEPPL